jgi:hypothetical protein
VIFVGMGELWVSLLSVSDIIDIFLYAKKKERMKKKRKKELRRGIIYCETTDRASHSISGISYLADMGLLMLYFENTVVA